MDTIKTTEELETLYNSAPSLAATVKVVDHITPHYRTLIEHAPFVAVATMGSGGMDCSPRGDEGQVVYVLDEKTLALPDRRGNNRIDSLRNILEDARVALLFLIPGSGTTLRVNGHAVLTADAELCQRFAKEGKLPRTVLLITVEACYAQCAKAVMRARLWDATAQVPKDQLPTFGEILSQITTDIDGQKFDTEWPDRAQKTMW